MGWKEDLEAEGQKLREAGVVNVELEQQQREAGEALKSQDQQIAEAGATLQEHGITAEETTLGEFHQQVEDHGAPDAPEPIAEPEAYEPTEADWQEMSDHYEQQEAERTPEEVTQDETDRDAWADAEEKRELEGEQAPDVTEPEADAPEVSEPDSPKADGFEAWADSKSAPELETSEPEKEAPEPEPEIDDD